MPSSNDLSRWLGEDTPSDWDTILYGTAQVASLTGLSPARVQQYCRLHGCIRIGGRSFALLDSDVLDLLNRRIAQNEHVNEED